MNVGDLVRIKRSDYAPFFVKPDTGDIGIIVEIQNSNFLGMVYYVQTIEGIWRFADYELELLDGSG